MNMGSIPLRWTSLTVMVCLSLIWGSIAAAMPSPEEANERDPFQPQLTHCAAPLSPAQWRLLGLVGHAERWVGWIKQAEDGWLKVRYDKADSLTEGVSVRLDRAGGTLRLSSADADCRVLEIPLTSPFHHRSQGVVP